MKRWIALLLAPALLLFGCETKPTIQTGTGTDLTAEVERLWTAANEVYNADDTEMFRITLEPVRLLEEAPAYMELFNYDEVVDGIFTANGRRQLEETHFAMDDTPYPLILIQGDQAFRAMGYKTGTSFAEGLVSAEVVGEKKDRVELEVRYSVPMGTGGTVEGTARFVIAREEGKWLVDEYAHPEEWQPEGYRVDVDGDGALEVIACEDNFLQLHRGSRMLWEKGLDTHGNSYQLSLVKDAAGQIYLHEYRVTPGEDEGSRYIYESDSQFTDGGLVFVGQQASVIKKPGEDATSIPMRELYPKEETSEEAPAEGAEVSEEQADSSEAAPADLVVTPFFDENENLLPLPETEWVQDLFYWVDGNPVPLE